MQHSVLPFVVFPMLVITVGLLLIVYFAKKKIETNYEKEMKVVRKLQVSGQLDRKSFFNLKNRLKVNELSSEQGTIFERMFREEKIDSVTYIRMRNALQISLNKKLKKFNPVP